MIARFDITQGTAEWHELRYAKIGGSTSKGLFVKSDNLLDEVLSELLEPFELEEDGYMSSDMIRGCELEPMARLQASQYCGVDFLECGWLQCEENKYLGISPDGITSDYKVSLEAKCPNKKRHTTTIRTNEIPSDNIHQCLHYFTVNPLLEKHVFVSFRPESIKPLFVKELYRYSMIDLGTKAKPNIKSINDWVAIAKASGKELSIEIENNYTKDQILEMYLNEVSYGGTAYGIAEASESYFGKKITGCKDVPRWRKDVSGSIFHRRKDNKDYPPKTRQSLEVRMEPWQKKAHDTFKKDLLLELPDGEYFASPNVLSMTMKLRQFLVCPKIISEEYGYGAGLEGILADAQEAELTHFVISTPFRVTMPYISQFFTDNDIPCYVLQGGTKTDELESIIAKWTKTGGVIAQTIQFAESYELPAARIMYMLGYMHSHEQNGQAEDRIHRDIPPSYRFNIGPLRKKPALCILPYELLELPALHHQHSLDLVRVPVTLQLDGRRGVVY